MLSRAELRAALVARKPQDHKGHFGHVLVVAGSRGMAGAAILSTRAALRSGAGLVTLAVPSGLQDAVAGRVPEALTIGLPENAAGCLRPEGVKALKQAHKERQYAALAVGPGLSRHSDTARFVIHVLSSLAVPAVVDADALNVLSAQDGAGVRQMLRSRGAPCVFTPHPGEMARCLGSSTAQVQRDRLASARRLAREWGGIALLKGHDTIIAGLDREALNGTGGSGLSKGGTGDVLTGLIAGLWAQLVASGQAPADCAFGAAALGAHLHGAAGDLAQRARTAWAMTAQDVIENLAGAFARL